MCTMSNICSRTNTHICSFGCSLALAARSSSRTTQQCFKMSWMMNGLMTERMHEKCRGWLFLVCLLLLFLYHKLTHRNDIYQHQRQCCKKYISIKMKRTKRNGTRWDGAMMGNDDKNTSAKNYRCQANLISRQIKVLHTRVHIFWDEIYEINEMNICVLLAESIQARNKKIYSVHKFRWNGM